MEAAAAAASSNHPATQPALPPHSDNVEEELGRIRLALNAVFSPTAASSSGDSSQQQWWAHHQLADRYLTSFQATRLSWMVCDRLLQEGDGGDGGSAGTTAATDAVVQQQRCFFAAQTLHTKFRNDMLELPAETYVSLRDSMLHHLQKYSQMPGDGAALTTRLAMCIAALGVQMNWSTIVTDLLQQTATTAPTASSTSAANHPLHHHSPGSGSHPHHHQHHHHGTQSNLNNRGIMAILRVLPEECASDRLLLLDDNNRFIMRDHLVSSAPAFFQYLYASMNQGDPQPLQVLQTLHTWIRYVPLHPTTLAESPLLQASVQALTQAEFLEPAADVVVEVLRMYPSHHAHNHGLVQVMIPLLSRLPFDEALSSDNEDVLTAYCRVVTEMGESYMSIILSPDHQQASQLVEWVLRCSGVADSEIASITLHFWYRMVMDLEGIDPFDWRQELVDVYTPHLLRLIDVCVGNLMRYPADVGDLQEDKVDDIQRHRFYVAETVEDCCRLLGGDVILTRIGGLLRRDVQAAMSSSSSGQHQQSAQTEWQGIESSLACISAIHRFVPSDENEYLPFCFGLIPQLPTGIRPLRFTASKLIGKFASWLAAHSNLLQPLLPYLAQGLSDADCAPAASVAIKELCECSNQSFAIAEPVLQLYTDISSRPGSGGLQLADELQVLEGACRAISRQIQDTRVDGTAFLNRLTQPIATRLSAAVADTHASPGRIIPEIERLTVVVQFLIIPAIPPNPHPMVEMLSSFWAYLDAATNRFPGDNTLAEKVCRLHKHALRCCGAKAYAPMVDHLIQQLVLSFERSRQSPFLYAASIVITEYGQDAAYAQKLYDMVASFSRAVFAFLRNLEDLTNHPDVAEEFFYLMGRMMNHCPDPVVLSQLLQSLVQCAVVGMQLDHQGANKGTLQFLEDMISYGLSLRELNKPTSQEALERVLSHEGQPIVANLARAMTGDLPCYNERQVPEILWKLNLLCPSLLSQWLAHAFHGVDLLPERAKADFMGALDTGLARDEFSLAVRAFQSACQRERRFRRLSQHAR